MSAKKTFMNADNNFLIHYGVLGMKWGVRKKRFKKNKEEQSSSQMTDDGLRYSIQRQELENKYLTLEKEKRKASFVTGKRLIKEIAYGSAKNIGEQLWNNIKGSESKDDDD